MTVERALQGAARSVERQGWLDPASGQAQAGVQSVYRAGGGAGQAVKDFLHGTWLGHPLHPVLVSLPLGAWTVAASLDGVGRVEVRRAVPGPQSRPV